MTLIEEEFEIAAVRYKWCSLLVDNGFLLKIVQ